MFWHLGLSTVVIGVNLKIAAVGSCFPAEGSNRTFHRVDFAELARCYSSGKGWSVQNAGKWIQQVWGLGFNGDTHHRRWKIWAVWLFVRVACMALSYWEWCLTDMYVVTLASAVNGLLIVFRVRLIGLILVLADGLIKMVAEGIRQSNNFRHITAYIYPDSGTTATGVKMWIQGT